MIRRSFAQHIIVFKSHFIRSLFDFVLEENIDTSLNDSCQLIDTQRIGKTSPLQISSFQGGTHPFEIIRRIRVNDSNRESCS